MTFEDYVIKSHPTGSNYICNPPVTDTDIDTVFLCNPVQTFNPATVSMISYATALTEEGWTPCVGEGYEILGGDFTAWRKGNENYIVTTDERYYKKYVFATKVCKAMNLLKKEDRIWMFKVLMEKAYMPSSGTLCIGPAVPGYKWHLTMQLDVPESEDPIPF